MSQFYKTEKTQFYHTDGTGRDSYINVNNGGHAAWTQENKQPLPGTMKTIETHYYYRSPYIHSKPV